MSKENQYLARAKKPQVYHILNGPDTLCRMVSTGGIKMARYRYLFDPMGLRLCHMCSKTKRESERGAP